jgi:hypothetical protein
LDKEGGRYVVAQCKNVVLPWLASAWFFDYGWDEEEGRGSGVKRGRRREADFSTALLTIRP